MHTVNDRVVFQSFNSQSKQQQPPENWVFVVTSSNCCMPYVWINFWFLLYFYWPHRAQIYTYTARSSYVLWPNRIQLYGPTIFLQKNVSSFDNSDFNIAWVMFSEYSLDIFPLASSLLFIVILLVFLYVETFIHIFAYRIEMKKCGSARTSEIDIWIHVYVCNAKNSSLFSLSCSSFEMCLHQQNIAYGITQRARSHTHAHRFKQYFIQCFCNSTHSFHAQNQPQDRKSKKSVDDDDDLSQLLFDSPLCLFSRKAVVLFLPRNISLSVCESVV